MDKEKTIPTLSQATVSGSVTASELRVGNLVYLPSKAVYSVDVLYKNYQMLEVWRPISITEQWLLNFGFEKSAENFNYFERVTYHNYTLTASKRMVSFQIDKYNNLSCGHDYVKYVHQLQNLYFALTGSELQLVV